MLHPGDYIKDIFGKPVGAAVTARGWVKTRRDSKGVSFVQLNDGSCFTDLQIVIDAGTVPEETLKAITTGSCISVTRRQMRWRQSSAWCSWSLRRKGRRLS